MEWESRPPRLTPGTREETITKGFKQVDYKLSYGLKSPYPFSNKDFSTPNLVLWMLQILTFNNHVRQQSENLRAPAAFHKDSLICWERFPVKANKDSTGCVLYSCQVVCVRVFSFSSPLLLSICRDLLRFRRHGLDDIQRNHPTSCDERTHER